MLRSIGAVVAGTLLAFVIIMVVEILGQVVYPLPEGVNPNDIESLKAAMAKMPAGALGFVLLAYALGTLAGAGLAAWIAIRPPLAHAMAVSVVLMAAAIVNMLLIPHPLWIWLAALAIFPVGAYAGSRLAVALKT